MNRAKNQNKRNHQKSLSRLLLGFLIAFLVFSPLSATFTTTQTPQLQLSTVHADADDDAGKHMTGKGEDYGAETDEAFDSLTCFAWSHGFNIPGCAAIAGYYVFYWPASKFLAFATWGFDIIINLNLSTTIISGGPFVQEGWTTVRDAVDGLFMFIILYVALSLILQVGTGNAKRMLVGLILVGLLVNFSLFFSRMVIDASNVVAFEIYKNMGQITLDKENSTNQVSGKSNYELVSTENPQRSLAQGVVAGFTPNEFVSPHMWKSLEAASKGHEPDLYFFLVVVVAAVVNVVAAFAFLAAAVMFIFRIIALWLLMIFAPFALFGFILPKLTGNFGGKWLSMLLSQAFVAPIFLFLMYLTMKLIAKDSVRGIFVGGTQTGAFYGAIMMLIVLAGIYIGMLIAIVGITAKLSGGAGKQGVAFGKFAVGRAVGAGVGTAGFTARHTVGRGMNRYANATDKNGQRRVDRWRARGGPVGNFAADGVEKGAKSSFDVRNTRLGMAGAGAAGIKAGKGRGAGGFRGGVDERNKKRDEIQSGLQDPQLQAEYRRQRLEERGVLGGKTQANKATAADMQQINAEYGKIQSDVAKADYLSKIGKSEAFQVYQKQKATDRAEIRKAAAESGMGDFFNNMEEQIRSMNDIAIAGGLGATAHRKEQEEREGAAKKGEAEVATKDMRKLRADDTAGLQKIVSRFQNDRERNDWFGTLSAAEQDQVLGKVDTNTGEKMHRSLSEEKQRNLEDARVRKAENEEKRANQQKAQTEKRENESRLRAVQNTHATDPGGATDSQDVRRAVSGMGKTIKDLDEGILKRKDVMQSLSDGQLKELEKAGKLSGDFLTELQKEFTNNANALNESARNYIDFNRSKFYLPPKEAPTPPPPEPPQGNAVPQDGESVIVDSSGRNFKR